MAGDCRRTLEVDRRRKGKNPASTPSPGLNRRVTNSNLNGVNDPNFSCVISLEMESLEMPKNWYDVFKPIIGNYIEVFDPVGFKMEFRIYSSNDRVLIWESVVNMTKYYSLKDNYRVDFYYVKHNTFRIRIFDCNSHEIMYGVGGSQNTRTDIPENVNLAADNSDHSRRNKNGEMFMNQKLGQDYVYVDSSEDSSQTDDGEGVIHLDSDEDVGLIEIGDSDDDGVDRSGPVINFSKIMTKAGVSRTKPQTLPLPRKYVRKHLRLNWKHLILSVAFHEWVHCELKWSSRGKNKGECSLGGDWYKFVKDHDLKVRDRVNFTPDSTDNNVVYVEIVRAPPHH